MRVGKGRVRRRELVMRERDEKCRSDIVYYVICILHRYV